MVQQIVFHPVYEKITGTKKYYYQGICGNRQMETVTAEVISFTFHFEPLHLRLGF